MVEPKYRWQLPAPVTLDAECVALGQRLAVSERVLEILARRGLRRAEDLEAFFAGPEACLHDPRLLPDAEAALRRVALARFRGERVLVFGDFDADGLTGTAILVLGLRSLGLDAAPYVPERLDEGHGLSLRAVETAASEGRTLVVTTDCGTTSPAEIEAAGRRGIDVVVTDHHHAAEWPAGAVAVVNPHRPDSAYPERRLTGAGVAWKLCQLLFAELGPERGGVDVVIPAGCRDLADLALIGTVADVAPLLGENRAIARLGLERLRHDPRPGLAALLRAAGVGLDLLSPEDVAFAIAPRLNAAGRVGEAARGVRLLLSAGPDEAAALAAEIEAANVERRDLTKNILAEAQAAIEGQAAHSEAASEAAAAESAPAILVVGEWPVGIIGLVAGRLAEDSVKPAIVASPADPASGILRASCRGPRGFDLAAALVACDDLLIRHGGHAAAAGFEIRSERWPELRERFLALAARAGLPAGRPELAIDAVLPATAIDYALVHELALIEPTGPGNPAPLLGVTGLSVARARSATGGHTQLVLKRDRDVLDAIAFRRPELADGLREGDRIDVVARAASRRFGGFESIQLEVLDVAAERSQLAAATGAQARPRLAEGLA